MEEKSTKKEVSDIPNKKTETKGVEAQPEPKKKKSKTIKRLIFIILFLLFLMALLVVIFCYILLKKTAIAPSTGAFEVAKQFENYYGKIEGSLGYPSEYIPAMGVCANNVKTKESFCTYKMIEDAKFTYGIGYEIEVPKGTYTVFAQLVDPEAMGADYEKDYKAYYSKFVTCGMSVDCDSHKALEVKVKGGESIAEIDPQDWYN